MDYNQQNQFMQNNSYPKRGFVIASMVCGILSIVLCCPGVGFILGALAILFAVLTRRKGQSMSSMALTGIITGSVGLFFGIIFMISFIQTWTSSSFQHEMYDSWETIYGEETADMLAEFYDFDINETK